jgi:hypothetical protein
MVRRPSPPHDDTVDAALPHFNGSFRRRYGLPPLTEAFVRKVGGDAELFRDVDAVRTGGVRDASCAILARIALGLVPRYAVGLIHGDRQVTVVDPGIREKAPFLAGQVLLVNPLGGLDNWPLLAKWFRSTIGERGRRTALAGLASETRRDNKSIDTMLRAGGPDGPAMVIPPSEGFSTSRASEVAFIYDVSIETLRLWRRKYRADRSSGRAGAPRRNR